MGGKAYARYLIEPTSVVDFVTKTLRKALVLGSLARSACMSQRVRVGRKIRTQDIEKMACIRVHAKL